jgi:SAM-dependent methyltransferase
MRGSDLLRRVDAYLLAGEIWPGPKRLHSNLGFYFEGWDLAGKTILEIGAGTGLNAIYCAASGAARVVAIEPEAAGATDGAMHTFGQFAEAVDLEGRVDYRPQRFDDFCRGYDGPPFDAILMSQVINHINEEATRRLHLPECENARDLYLHAFRQMKDLLGPGGLLVAADVGRRNFWHAVGLASPFAPTIEWDKHQQPRVWQTLLVESGFEPLDVRWLLPFRLRRFGLRRLPGWASSFLDSYFVLRCRIPVA